ncbi:MAG: deoxyribodipyrimidine photo-lyase [Planctomycetota bacterium]
MVHDTRLQALNNNDPVSGQYVLYWMQQSQRAEWNTALEYAIERANELDLPVFVAFGITQRFPEANERHYTFMLEGLHQTMKRLRDRGLHLVVRMEPPVELATRLADKAAMIVTDRGYLRIQKKWRQRVASNVPCRMVQVESDAVVPVHVASDKEEYAARTLRPKIKAELDTYLKQVETVSPRHDSTNTDVEGLELNDIEQIVEDMRISRDANPVDCYIGGSDEAHKRLQQFTNNKLGNYSSKSNDPNADCVSHLSPYLHFGQISPVEIAMTLRDAPGISEDNRDAFLEQLIVRRELSFNFCEYNDAYDQYECLPAWALETLADHADDKREYTYTKKQLEQAETHDPYWNAAQKRMMATGYMHNYMRMYWGKKILEWTPDPRMAFQTTLELNNRYELDGRDPCSFANVAWCFGKHDQGWKERPVYGKVRYMNDNGLKRKFDMDCYLKRTQNMLAG